MKLSKYNDISGVYIIKSKIKPKRVYIGSSKNIGKRWGGHLAMLKYTGHYNKELQKHYDKYGENDLEFLILQGCEKSKLKAVEQFYIDCFNPYFNFAKTTGAGFHW
jgi:group I intron endonuclease